MIVHNWARFLFDCKFVEYITESELTFSLVAMAAAQLQSQYKQSEYFADPG